MNWVQDHTFSRHLNSRSEEHCRATLLPRGVRSRHLSSPTPTYPSPNRRTPVFGHPPPTTKPPLKGDRTTMPDFFPPLLPVITASALTCHTFSWLRDATR